MKWPMNRVSSTPRRSSHLTLRLRTSPARAAARAPVLSRQRLAIHLVAQQVVPIHRIRDRHRARERRRQLEIPHRLLSDQSTDIEAPRLYVVRRLAEVLDGEELVIRSYPRIQLFPDELLTDDAPRWRRQLRTLVEPREDFFAWLQRSRRNQPIEAEERHSRERSAACQQ